MSFEESLKNLIAWMDSEYRKQPGIWNRNLGQSNIVGQIGMSSNMQIDDLERQKHGRDENA